MTISLAPNETDILSALKAFVGSVLPGIEVDQGQQNRVPEPSATDFIEMWPLMRPRLATNVVATVDTVFTGAIAGTVLTVSAIATNSEGSILPGAALFGIGVADGSVIGAQLTGPTGGIGTYNVTPSQTISAETMASGQAQSTQETEIVVQLDVHSASLETAGNMAQTISTMFRDPSAVDFFATQNPNISPLYSDDPRQSPFLDAEQQYETRWTVDVHLQANQTVSGIPQQFADALTVEIISVDATYSP